MIFGIVSCNFDGNSSTNQNQTENPDSQEEKEAEEPEKEEQKKLTVPKIESGYYMAGDWQNVVVIVYNDQVLIKEFKDVDAFYRISEKREGDEIATSEISTTLDWYTPEISAFKIAFKGNTYYLYEQNEKIKLAEKKQDGTSDAKTLAEIPIVASERTNWLKPDDGIYVSSIKAPFGEKTYMYAKFENQATKLTLYYAESNTLKDLSGLTPAATINSISYSFRPVQLEYKNSDWVVTVHNKAFKVKPAQGTASTISFKAVSAE